jgi:hypothetical protein
MSEAASMQGASARAHEAFRRGDLRGALAIIEAAEAQGGTEAPLKLQKAMVKRAAGDFEGALKALDEALALDPYDFVALLSKGALTERVAGERAAASIYRDVLKFAPAEDKLPAQLVTPTAHAREVVARTAEALESYLRERLAEVRADCSGEPRRRFEESVGVFAGRTRVYNQEPLLLHYPGLPAIPFYDRSHFSWLPELEAATDMIRSELEVALETARDKFAPYIQRPLDEPANQWAELNHNPRWSSLFLWKDGRPEEPGCALCPRTAALIERLPLADQPGFAPLAVFSALQAKTHIPPHTGSTNVRLLCHLPLILPGPARFRVGNETREWKMGEAWVFDDTIEHEAWNDADALRVILILDVWNPFLDEGEKALINAMMSARKAFFAGEGG